jgi:hypothetical protein
MSNTPRIKVTRRRKADRPTGQAQAPIRRGTGSTGGGSPFGGFRVPQSSGGKLGCGSIPIIILIVIIYLFSSQDGGTSDDQYTYDDSPAPALPTVTRATSTPRPTRAPSESTEGESWLVMMYMDADDQVLEQDIFLDLNEAERVGSTDQVTIVAQLDRFRGGFSGDQDWRSTRRYLVTHDDDLNAIGSELIEDIGEANMADGNSLVDFVTWAVSSYPADRYALIMSDHGLGWPGGWTDGGTQGTDSSRAPIVQMIGQDAIFLSELDDSLARIQNLTGIEKLDLIGMDACLMSQIEVYMMLQPYARYAVASEETEPALGWAYAAFLSQLVDDPSMDGAQLAANIVDSYIEQDQRIIDDQARNDFLAGNVAGGYFGAMRISADQLAGQLTRDITLTAVDLDAIVELNERFNAFAYALQDADQGSVASARNYAQSYTSIFGKQVSPSYIDLGHFVQLAAQQTGDSGVRNAASAVLSALGSSIVAEKHGTSKPGSTGIAVYFPNSTLYRSPYTGLQSYTQVAGRFARASLWDDFIGFHYSNRPFEADAAEPVAPSLTGNERVPGLGNISISQIDKSADNVTPGEAVTLSAEISGENIGYIYFFTGYYDPQSNSILMFDTDFLESSDTRELSSVYYPVWPDSQSFIMDFDWEPTLFYITDGSQQALALFNPVTYGASAEDAVYMVEGVYIFSGSEETRKAQLHFKDGKLFQVFGFAGSEDVGAPAEIYPQNGDQFTITLPWMNLDASGNVSETVYESGDTITFGSAPFRWEQLYAPDGNYLAGFLVADLDGNRREAYTQITVE